MALRVTAVGRLVADPEQPTNGPAKFRLAVDGYNRETKQREATFWDCVAWGKTGETIMKYAQKGKQMLVAGEMNRREYVSKMGEKRQAVEINVADIELLGGGSPSASQPNQSSSW